MMDNLENGQDLPETELVLEEMEAIPVEATEEAPEVFADEPIAEETVIEPEILPATQPKKKGRGMKVLKAVIALALVVVLVAVGSGATAIYLQLKWNDDFKRNEQLIHQMQQTIEDLREEIKDNSFTGNGNSLSGTPNTNTEGLTPAQVYAQSVDSVVLVSATVTRVTGQTGKSTGSGFVISEDGYVVTNYHVVDGASSVSVTLHNGLQHKAKVVGFDNANDVAVLKIEAKGLDYLTVGSSSDLIVGDQVVAIGNPLGKLTATLTVGYVSAKDRVITTEGSLINMIQTDVAINSGNSGGPLLNMKGEVVGITTAKYSGTSSSGATIEGIGFAIPMDDVWKKITDLRDFGYITGAALGVMVHDVDQQMAIYYGLPMGAYITEVNASSAAERAGVMAKDIIIGINDDQITSLNELSRVLGKYSGGEDTTITVWRGGKEVVLNITLDTRTPDF